MKWIDAILAAVPTDYTPGPLEPTYEGNRVLGTLDSESYTAYRAVEYQFETLKAERAAHRTKHRDPNHTEVECNAFHAEFDPRLERTKLLQQMILEELRVQFADQLKPGENIALSADGVVAMPPASDGDLENLPFKVIGGDGKDLAAILAMLTGAAGQPEPQTRKRSSLKRLLGRE